MLGKFAKDVEGEGKVVFGEEHPLQPQRKGIYLVVFEIIQGPQGRHDIFFSTVFPIYFSTTN